MKILNYLLLIFKFYIYNSRPSGKLSIKYLKTIIYKTRNTELDVCKTATITINKKILANDNSYLYLVYIVQRVAGWSFFLLSFFPLYLFSNLFFCLFFFLLSFLQSLLLLIVIYISVSRKALLKFILLINFSESDLCQYF